MRLALAPRKGCHLEKRLALLRETVPRISRVALFRDPEYDGPSPRLDVARSLGVELHVVELQYPQPYTPDLDAYHPALLKAFEIAASKRAEAVLVGTTLSHLWNLRVRG